MKQRLKTIIVIAILLVIAIWIIDKIPFNKNINQQITANIYENGVTVGQTTLVMNGEKSNYLFYATFFDEKLQKSLRCFE
jgi:hypothetical protein